MSVLALYIAAYLFGSIPFAVILGRSKGIDILSFGSGNPGMTNVMRALGPVAGGACFVLDVLKGLLPSALARLVVPNPVGPFDPQLIWFGAGLMAILGHCASVFLRFKGGKGVSTALGAITGTSPWLAILCFGFFLVILAATRYMALASVLGVSSVLVFLFMVPGQSHQLFPILFLLSAFVVYRHQKNFKRMRDGTEPKFSFRRTARQIDAAQSNEPVAEPKEEVEKGNVDDIAGH